MPPIEDQRRASVTYARTSAFSELDHKLIRHPKSQRGAAAHKPTGLRSPWNVDSGSASAPTVAEAGMADEPAVVAGAGINEECVDAVTQARAMLIRHEAAEIVEAAGMRETLTSRQGCHA